MNVREEVLTKCWNYLNNNFHKFSETNKIKVALILAQKSMPTTIDQTVTHELPKVELGGRVKEYHFG